MAAANTADASMEHIGVKNTTINTEPGVQLYEGQRVIVGSVLDLFEGRPSLKHLSLWNKSATFQDPIALAQGYDRFAAQWYGLAALFDPIQIQSHSVTSGGNPIEIRLSNKYTLKGVKVEKLIDSVVRVHVGNDGLIQQVEDRWNGQLPDGAISEAFRKLNAMIASSAVTVPKTEEEDKQMQKE